MGKSILEKVIGDFQEIFQQSLRQTPDQDYQEFLDQLTPSTASDGNIQYLDAQGNVMAIRYQDGTVEVDPELIEAALVSHDPNAGEIPPDGCQSSPCPDHCNEIEQVCYLPTEKADTTQRQAKRFGDRAPVAKSKSTRSDEKKDAEPAEDKPPVQPMEDDSGIEVDTYSKKLDDSEELPSDDSPVEEVSELDDSPKACGVMGVEEQADSTQVKPLSLPVKESSSFTFSAHLCFEIPMPGDGDDVEGAFDAGRGQKGIGLGSQTHIQDGAPAMMAGRTDTDQRDDLAPLDDQCTVVPVSSGLPKEDAGIGEGEDRLEYMARGFGVYREGKLDRHPGSKSPFCASRTSDGGLASGRSGGLREKLGVAPRANDDLLAAYETSSLGGQPHMLSFAALAGPGQNSQDDLRIANRVEHPEPRGDQRDNLDREQQERRDGSLPDGSDETDEDDA